SNSYLFFFSSRRRHTRLQGDWSSDVCSSDLGRLLARHEGGVCHFDAPQPFDRHVPLVSRHEKAHRVALFGPDCFAVLAVREEARSEERRVGKECRTEASPKAKKKRPIDKLTD